MRHVIRPAAALFTTALFLSAGSCKGIFPTDPLTPARALAGTWTTPFAVPMSYQTDFCSGSRENVAKGTWSVTWIVTAQAGTTNGIDVEMHMTQSGFTRVASSCGNGGTGCVPEPSPKFLTGTISGSVLQLYNHTGAAFDGNLTTDNITGTFGAWECLLYCSGEKSDPLKFILTRHP